MIAILLLAAEGAWPYVAAAYLAVFGLIAAYVVSLVVRGRRAGRQLPPDERRWM